MKYLPIFLLVLAALTPTAQSAEQGALENWYQVDVIVFKPRRTDMDDESWPETEIVYPSDLVAVTEPAPFKLSQLEGLDETAPVIQEEIDTFLPADEFIFQSQSRGQQNQRTIERLTGRYTDPKPEANEDEELAESASDIPEETPFDLAALLNNQDPLSSGRLAFSDTDGDSSLATILRSLNRSSRFDVLTHQSWIQPIHSEATQVLFQTGQRYDDLFEVEGVLAFSRSRYLHVRTDLWYTVFEPRGGSANPYLTGIDTDLPDETLQQYPDLVKVEQQRGQYYPARSHHMQQSRRMRSGELHYLDHPLMGVIVRINRYTHTLSTDVN